MAVQSLPALAGLGGGTALLLAGAAVLPGVLLALVGIGLGAMASNRFARLSLVQLVAGLGAAAWALVQPGPAAPWWVFSGCCLVAVAWHLDRSARRRGRLEAERDDLARQVDRRINEIFSLQELSYILAESLRSDRIAEQVADYVLRFLHAGGAAVALAREHGALLEVGAAAGSLEELAGREIPDQPASLVTRAARTERIEVSKPQDPEPLPAAPGCAVRTAAAAPLRAHGLTMGVLLVADPRAGVFTAEDLWLLSTVSTHVAVVLANSRLYELVRQAKEEWETAFNALTEGIAVLDAGGRMSRANGGLARLLETPAPALLGRPFWAMVAGPVAGEEELLAAARRGERPAPLTVQSRTLDRTLRLTVAPLAEPGNHAAIVVLVEDVTEQRALEAQLIQSEKLAAVGQLVSGLAHELNNPLTSIAGLSEFLQERARLPEGDQQHLRVIREQAERAGRIVQNLLTFARKGSPGAATVDLNDVVERTVLLLGYELQLRGITLEQDRAPGPLLVRGNRDELQQVLLNLVTNAVQAVRDLPAERARRVTLITAQQGARAEVRVLDTGNGVLPELIPQLFTPFFTTKEPGHGTGLGLSLSYRIVESHGGRLEYRSAPGGGAEFGFRLPLGDQSAEPVPAPAEPPAGRRAALIIDGDAGSELVVRALLEPAGYLVEVAKTGADAPRRLAERHWAIVVLDGRLSADGRHLLVDQLGAAPPRGESRPRVLVSTGDPILAERCRATGLGILPRPFLPRDLMAVVGEGLAG